MTNYHYQLIEDEKPVRIILIIKLKIFPFVFKDQDLARLEHDYVIQQQMMLSKTATLNEILTFKKELEKSDRQREQLSDHLEVLFIYLFSN
jgi:hypothetical protein